MKQRIVCIAALLVGLTYVPLQAQPIADGDGDVVIGSIAPNPSAILDLVSTGRGFLLPRMTTAQRNAIPTPAGALMIFNTTTENFEYWDAGSGQWETFVTTANLNGFAWRIIGNNSLTAWNGATGNFLGMQDNIDLVLKTETASMQFWTGNTEQVRLTSDGNLGLGTPTPAARLDLVNPTTDNGVAIAQNGTAGSGLVVDVTDPTNNTEGVDINYNGLAEGINLDVDNVANTNQALDIDHSGLGEGIDILLDNPANTERALDIEHQGVDEGINLDLSNAANAEQAIDIEHQGVGEGINLALSNAANGEEALDINHAGTGEGITIELTNGANTNQALQIEHAGTGDGIRIDANGGGLAIDANGGAIDGDAAGNALGSGAAAQQLTVRGAADAIVGHTLAGNPAVWDLVVEGDAVTTGIVKVGGSVWIDGTSPTHQVQSSNPLLINTVAGNIEIDAAGGQTTIDDNAVVTGTSDLQGAISNTSENNGGNVLINDNATVAGNFNVQGNTDLDANLNVDGPSTFNNTIDQLGGAQVTFTGNVDAQTGLDVSGQNLTVDASVSLQAPGAGHTMGTLGTDATVLTIDGLINNIPAYELIVNGDVQFNGGVSIPGLGANSVVVTDATGNLITDNPPLGYDATGNVLTTPDIVPNADNLYSLGTDAVRWAEVYIDAGTLHVGPSGGEAGDEEMTIGYGEGGGEFNTNGGDPEFYISSSTAGFLVNLFLGQNLDVDGNTQFYGAVTQWGDDQVTFNGNVDAQDGLDVAGSDLTVDAGVSLQAPGSGHGMGTLGTDATVLTIDGLADNVPAYELIVNGDVQFNGAVSIPGFGANSVVVTDASGNLITDNPPLGYDATTDILTTPDIVPDADNTYSLGTDAVRWAEVYIDAGTLHVGPSGGEAGNEEITIGYVEGGGEFNVDGGATEFYLSSDEGDLRVDLFLSQDLEVDGDARFNGSVDAEDGLNVAGSDLTVDAGVSLQAPGTGHVLGTAGSSGTVLTINGLQDATGTETLPNSVYDLAVTGDIAATGMIKSGAGVWLDGVSATHSLTADQPLDVRTTGANDLTLSTNGTTAVTVDGTTQDVDIANTVTIGGNLDFTGATSTISNSTFGAVGFADDLTMTSGADIIFGNGSLMYSPGEAVTVNDDLSVTAGNLAVTNGGFSVVGNSTLGDAAGDETTVNGNLDVTNGVDVTGGEVTVGSNFSLVTGANARLTANDAHVRSTQTTAPVSAVAGGNVTTAALSNATDVAGMIDITTSGAPAVGAQATVTFDVPYDVAPIINLTPANGEAAGIGAYVSRTANGFTISFIGLPAATTSYQFFYQVIETQ